MNLLNVVRSTRLVVTLAVAGVMLGACAGESTAPVLSSPGFQYTTSPLAPSAATRSLVGVTDGTYEFNVDPSREQNLYLGYNALFIPPNSICALGTSSYGVGHWDEDCKPQRANMKITAVVRNAKSQHPSIDFYPALRFSPKHDVYLYFYVPHGSAADKANFVMDYCNDAGACYDESITDPTLATQFNAQYSVVYRRIKHFSGYIVIGATDDPAAAAAMW